MIKSRFTNILSTVVCCLFLITFHFAGFAAPPDVQTCNCVVSIASSNSCSGSNGGSATVSVTGSYCSSPFTYRWSNNATTAAVSNLSTGTYTVTVTANNGCTASQSVSISSVSFNVAASADVSICKGTSTQLSATGATMYSWSPTTGLSDASISNPVASPTATTTYTVTGAVSSGELATNGNFSSGNTGFTSGYGYISPGGSLNPEGKYAVDVNANSYHSNFFGTDHTTGSGKFMIINGATVAGVEVWRQTVNVTPNTTYYFSTWITALNSLVSANLAFSVNGTLMGPIISSPASQNSWIQFYAVWNSGTATVADISIVNQNTIANGNDFGLDDISFTTVCTKTDQVKVTVKTVTASAGADQTICTGQSATLTATGGGTYVWSTGATTASITVSPASTTTYTVTVTNNGCAATSQVKVTRITSNIAATVAKTDAGCKKDSTTVCVLTLATSQHGLWLDDIPSAPSKYHKITGTMTATKYSDGRLQLAGTFENVSDATRKWTIDVMYTNKMNWTDWSARGGSWKGQAANVGTNYQNWDYYVMDVTYANKLVGSGTYAGKTLNLTHMPSNYLYGFQVGQGANDQTADWGMSGWFEHTGSWTGNGDLNFDAVCSNTQYSQTTSCNGSATLAVTNSTAPVTYAWSNGRTSKDVSGLCAGTYTVTITDGTGCTISKSVTIGTTAGITATCNSTDVTTQGGTNGSVSVNVTGGVVPYTYRWNTSHTTQTVTNRSAGVYTVTITDSYGCPLVYTCCVKQPSVCDGQRTQTQGGWGTSPSGGNPGVYLYANFASAFPSGVTVGCATGFTLKLTTPQAVTAFLPSGSTPSALTSNLINPGQNYDNVLAGQVVALTLSVGFDNANANFGPSTTPLQNMVVVSGTFANWTVAQVLAEANKKLGGCTSSYSFSQLNDAVSAINEDFVDGNNTGNYLKCGLDLTTVKVDVKCYGQSTGSIDLTVSGGLPPYTYSWSNGATTQDLVNIPAGTYTVNVRDANNLPGTATVTINQPAQLALTTTSTNLNCFGACTGTASVTATGGTAPYTYKWNTNATTASITNRCAGTYTVTVTDANNCTAVKTATITQPADLISSIAKTDVSCGSGNIPCQVFQYAAGSHAVYLPTLGLASANWVFGSAGGSVETYANGTARIYGNIYYQGDTTKSFFLDFNFNNKMNWTQWSALGRTWKGDANIVGTNYQNWTYYTFSTTTASTLTGRNSYIGNNMTIAHYPANYSMGLQIGLAANDKNGNYGLSTWFTYAGWKSGQGDLNGNLQCASGQCNGTTTVTVSGGTSPYTYAWSNGVSTQNQTGLCPGTYTVTITDNKGCKDTLTATIGNGSELNLSATGTNIACAGVCNGTATVSASGGSTPYTYLWSNGATTQSLSSICAGTYMVTVTDNKGCFGKDTVVITANPKPSITATPTHVNCFGGATGSVTTVVSGGTTPYTYSWTPGGATTANLTGKAAGTYTVILTDVNGCKDTATATITQPTTAVSATISSTPVSCIGGNDGTATVVPSGGTSPYTYLWSNGRTTAAITGLTVGSYTVTVTDAKACTVVKTIAVTGVPPLTLGSVPSPVLCNGGNTGSINLTVSGGTPGYTFLWSNGRTTEDISGLVAGTYTVTVTDAKGCVATASVSVSQPQPLVATLTPAHIACFGGNTGAISVSVVGGTSPFTYIWSSGATTRDITALAAGTYTVTVTDANGCKDIKSSTITQQPSLVVTATPTHVTCFGLNNGSIITSVSGGVAPYTYNWGGGITTANRTGLAPGTYTVTVSDANNCTGTATVTVTQPSSALNATISATPVSCIGGSDGTATVVPSGGTSPYTYLWSNGPTTAAITGLTVGSYTVTVTDNKACTVVKTIAVTGVPPLTIGSVPSPASCYNTNTGSIDVTISGGTPGYTFLWSNGRTTEDVTGLAAGTYTVTVTDSKGCVATASVTVGQPADLISSIVKTDVSCGSGNIPCQVFQYAAGAHAVYLPTLGLASANWVFGSAGGSVETYANGTARIYGNIYYQGDTTKSFFLDFNFNNKMNWTQWSALGRTWKGDANIVGTNYQNWTYYTFSTTTASTLTGRNSYVGNNMTIAHYPANYSMGLQIGLAANDKNGNYGLSTWFTYAGWKSGQGDLNGNLQCASGQCDGSTDVTVSGGTSPYTYVWNNGATTQDLTGVCPGTYTVTITDAKGCKDTLTTTIGSGVDLNVNATGVNVSCAGICNGTATATATGGTAPFTYLWSNGATTQSLTSLCAGTYIVTVTDSKGCFGKDTIVINANPKPEIAATATPVNCFGGSTGGVTTTVTGGTAPYSYTWTPGGATTANLTNRPAGTYTVILTDVKGCKDTASATIAQPADSLNGVTSSTPVSCIGGTDGTATVVASGGTAPYTYVWNTTPVRTTASLTGLRVGSYSVTITDAKGCTAVRTVTVTGVPPLTLGSVPSPVLCNGGNTGSINLTISGGTPGYTFLWSNGATTEDITGLTAGSYNVTVTDSKGCVATAGVSVTQPQPLAATATAVNIACFGGNTGGVNVSVVGGTSPFTYIWSNGATTRDITGVAAGTYTATVTDVNGCKDTVSATVTQQSALQVSATPIHVTCFGLNNGSITTAINGGLAPYTYNWGAGQPTTANRSNLAPGTYTVTVTDANNCTGTATATITQPLATLSATISSTPVSCIGGSDGTATVVASGGTSPYTYLWSNSRTTAAITGLVVGSYTVTITDSKACTLVKTIAVTGVPPLTIGSVPSPVLCNGGTTGSINLTVSGGTPGYTFLWSNGATTEDISNLTAGTYNVTVTDSKGCVATAGVTVTQPQALVATLTPTQIPCFGGAAGSITVSVVGGSSPFTYAWSNGAVTRDITGLIAGTYTVTVTDVNGCKDIKSATITQQTQVQVSVAGTNLTCYANSTGSATANPSGGVAPYTYAWSTTPARTTKTITGLTVGTYRVTVTDANSCTATGSVVVTQPDSLEALTSCNALACYGDTTAHITLLVVGGTTPYTYLWSTGATTRDLPNRGAGTYTVTVTDAKGCTITSSAIVAQPALLVATASPLHIACNGAATGGVNLSVIGGTTPYTYIWSNGATTQNLSGLVAGTYTVTITDAKGCKDTARATINQQSQLQVTATPSNIPCFGQNNGSITTSVNGGVAPYTYNWGAGQPTTANRSGLAPGTYKVTVTDANACTGTATATITQPADSLNGVTSSTPVSCIGGTDGTASVVASGGTAPYTYVWSTTPARITAALTGLRVGSYTVTITDAKGCTVVRTVLVTGVPPLVIGSVPSPVLCNGGNTGSINATISGGTPGYTFLWSNGATTEDISNLTAGTYNVTVTDAKGCVATAGVTVTQPQPVVATATPQHIACFGATNGGVNLSVVGGTSPFTYIWSNGAVTRDITGVVAGTYTVTVTDKNGCKDTASATVNQQLALQVTLAPTNVTCFGLNNGSITTAVNGGVAPYTYTWNTAGVTTANRTNLAPGTYNVTVSDANGCTGTATTTITQPSAPLAASAVKTDVNCFGQSTGTVTLTVSGGTTAYTYLWSNGATTKDLTALAAGTYTVTVTDANLCTTTASATVTQPNAALNASAAKTDVNCFGGNNGTVTLTVSGGTTAYSFLWSNGAVTQNLTGLVAGTYTVTVTDAKGCTTTASATITQPSAALAASAAKTDVNCFGGNNGTVTLTVSGGTTPYTFNWGGGVTTQNRTGLTAGTYTVTVTDAKACTTTATATVAQPADSLNGVTSSTPVSCIGGTDGTVTVVASGGTAPYTYVWSTTPTRVTAALTGLRVGSYTVTVTDAKGCNIVRTVNVTGVPPLTIGSVPSPVLCFGGNTGSINVTISGGTPGYTFLWSNGATTEDISNLTAGTYNVTVTDAKGCVATAGVTVTQPQPVDATATPQHIACFGATNGGVNVSVVGGTSPFTYIWSNGATTRDITGVQAGTYTVTVTDVNGCKDVVAATVNQQSALQVTLTPTNVTCFGLNNGSITSSVNGGVAPYTYNWGAGQPTTANRGNLAPGTYNVTVTDGNGCTGTANATITQPDLLTGTATGSALLCFGNQNGTVTLTVGGGTAPYTYNWNNQATTQDLSGLAAGNYTVTITDAKGCTATASATVTQPTLLAATATGSLVNCFGDVTGNVTLTVSGGRTAYTYLWSNGATTKELNGVAAGTYSVTVTDANGCTTTASATVTQPSAALAATAAKTDVNCFGGNNGTVTLTVSGGTTPYTFNWGGGVTTQNRTGLIAGTYTVTVTDAKACTTTATATVAQPADSLNGVTSSTPVSCIGGTDGTASVVASGGTAPYTYVWSTTPPRMTATITGLRVGSYTVTITDAKGCNIVRTVPVTGVPPLTLGSVPTPVSCFGGSNGSINLTATGGTPGYTFKWSNGAVTEDVSGLAAGTYNVTVTDAKGCVATVSVVVQQPAVITLSFVATNATTHGGTNGTINLSVVGGTSPFTYIWSNGGTTQNLTGLAAGNYCVTVTDLNGCTATGCKIVTEPSCNNLTPVITPTQVSCFGGSNGAATVAVTGGTAPYTYNWGGGITTQNRTGLAAGTYSVTVTDGVQCTGTASVTITQPAVLAASAAPSNPTCDGTTNGSIALTATGGTAPFTYNWSNGATTQNLNGLAGGNYSVTITDVNGCTASASTALSTPAAIDISSVVTNVRCFLGSDGAIDITVSGGTPAYTFRWSNGATTKNITALRAGSYTITVTDANGCSASKTMTVTQPGPLTLGASPTPVSCFQGSNGAIALTVSGGTAPYVYIWSNGATSQNLSGLTAGVFNVTVTDSRSCVATVSVNVLQPAAINLSGVITNACGGGNSGAIQLNVVGGTSPFTYRWSNGATTKNIGSLIAGNYAVTVTDANGCVANSSFTVGTNVNCRTMDFTVNVMLEGPFEQSNMKMQNKLRTQCNTVPLFQPYNSPSMGYNGTESVGNLGNDVVDWVLVSFRTGTDRNTEIYKVAGLLNRDGKVRTVTGDTIFQLNSSPSDSLYVVVEHRNHMGVMTPVKMCPANASNGVICVDFTRTQSYTTGSPATAGQKILGTDSKGPIYGMHAGDSDCNFDINSNDFVKFGSDFNKFDIYSPGDFNMDCDCNSNDLPKWLGNFNQFSGVR